ncbi:D-ribose ABC transporter substrate-binding protein [soil metagenome]
MLGLVLALRLSACGTGGGSAGAGAGGGGTEAAGGSEAAAGGSGEGGTVGLALSTLQNPFFVTLRDGATAAAAEQGVAVLISDAQDDAQSQANDMQNFITQGVDAIVVNPVDSAAIVPAIEAANEADIPVITVDRAADGGEIASHIASDNVQGGKMAGEFLFEQIDGSGNVAELQGVAGTSAARDRGEGFGQAVEEASGINVVAEQSANFSRDEGFTVTQNILQGNQDLAGIFGQNDEMALGAVEAAREAGRLGDVAIVGFDAVDDALAAIEAGDMAGTVAQQPELLGQLGIETAAAAINGEDVESEQAVEVTLVTQDNVAEFMSDAGGGASEGAAASEAAS